MKLGIGEINEGIHFTAVNKVARQLKREGFVVYTEYSPENNRAIRLDLFAQKGMEKRIYEFKLGKNKIQREKFVKLQNYAKHIGARLFIIYLELPASKKISFDGIADIIFEHFQEDTPTELLELATKVYIDDVDDVNIQSIDVNEDIISLDGEGTVYVEIEFGSRSDIRNGDGLNEKLQFDFYFRLKLDHYNKKVIYSYYKIDTEWYYS